MKFYSIILAAGKGTRMKSEKPKVIHDILDVSMINLVLNNLEKSDIKDHIVITGHKSEEVLNNIKDYNSKRKITNVLQKEQLGTGHAVKIAEEVLKDKKGITIITCGDTPLITGETFKNLIEFHKKSKNDLTILSADVINPFGYGRIVRNTDTNDVKKIVEQKDADEMEQKIKEINSGVYCIDNEKLFDSINELDNDNSQGEYYLTDIVQIFKKRNYKVGAYKTFEEEILGINDLVTLEKASKIMQKNINVFHMKNGVQIIDSDTTYIGNDVKIGAGTKIFPNNVIIGKVEIGKNNNISMGNNIENSTIGNQNQIGPMAHLRQNTKIANHTRIGNYVEMKNVILKDNSKVAHLTYLGDSEVGENVNVGCGVITANYDGENKYRTIIKDDVFIGSNSNLIAPITIEKGTFIAAGSTVTKDVEENKFAIARSKLKIKDKK